MSDHPSDVEFELKNILIALRDVNTEWYDLGIYLDLPEHILKPIGSNPGVKGGLRVMVSEWRDYDPQASWDKLAAALNAMGKNTIAANIRSKYVRAPPATPDPATEDDKTCMSAKFELLFPKNYDLHAARSRKYTSFPGLEMTQVVLQKMKGQFASLQLEVRSAMEARDVKVSDVHQFLVSFFQSECCIPEAPDLTKLFNIVTEAKLWRYDHYGPLEELAEAFLPDDNPTRKHVSKYKDQLSGFYVTTKIVDLIDLSDFDDSDDDSDTDSEHDTQQSLSPKESKKLFRKLKVTLKLDRTTKFSDMTMSYVDTLWKALIKEFNLPPLTAIIKKIVGGSLIITWLVPPQVSTVITASYAKALRFYQQNNIVEIQLDGCTLYCEDWIDGSTLLYQASFMGNTEEVKELLEGGADVNEQNDNVYGDTALFGACRGGHVETTRTLLHHGADVDLQNNTGETSLMRASRSNSRDVLGIVLEANADPNITDEDGWSALYWAAFKGHVEVVKALVMYGAALDIGDKNGQTGLMWASASGYTETVNVLLEAKADPNIINENGETALHKASLKGHIDIVQLLVKYGAAVDIRDKVGDSSLMEASSGGYKGIIEVLLEAGADPNITNEYGETALHKAALSGHVEAIELLVKHEAAVDIRNKYGLTALDVARGGGYQDVCDLLEKYTKEETSTELTQESIYQRLLKMLERTFLKEQVKKREEQQKKEPQHQGEERVGEEREKRSLLNRLRGRRDRPGKIIGAAQK